MFTVRRKSERGQAIVLLALGIMGLVGMTALAIDGGNAFADKRNAQDAADTAALAAALAEVRGNDSSALALSFAAQNGYDNDGTSNTVTYHNPPISGPYTGDNEYIQIFITSEVETFFAPVIGVETTTNTVEAVARAKPPTTESLYDGNAIVGLSPDNNAQYCAFDSGHSNAVEWTLKGGGIFSNGCAYSKNHDSVTLPTDPAKCVTAVDEAYNFTCMQGGQTSQEYSTEDIAAMMPPTPACNDTASGGYNVPDNPSNFTFENGVYCVSDFDDFSKEDIVLNNATLYVTDMDFVLKFAGQGGFAGTATTSGPYEGYFLIIAINPNTCGRFQDKGVQVMEFRGHADAGIVGTILAPSACLDFRGNSNGATTHSQIIANYVTSNGNSELTVEYNPEENGEVPVPPQIELAQ